MVERSMVKEHGLRSMVNKGLGLEFFMLNRMGIFVFFWGVRPEICLI
jgi:hypothetical protein